MKASKDISKIQNRSLSKVDYKETSKIVIPTKRSLFNDKSTCYMPPERDAFLSANMSIQSKKIVDPEDIKTYEDNLALTKLKKEYLRKKANMTKSRSPVRDNALSQPSLGDNTMSSHPKV